MSLTRTREILTNHSIPIGILTAYMSRLKALRTLEHLSRKVNLNENVYVLPWPSIGDSVAVESLLDKQCLTRSTIITPSERSSSIFALAGWSAITLSLGEVKRIVRLFTFANGVMGIKLAHYGVKYITSSINRDLIGFKGTTYFRCLSDVVFGGISIGKSSKDFSQSSAVKGNVLLCPESKTLEAPPSKFWDKLEDKLKSAGFKVALNSPKRSNSEAIYPAMKDLKEAFSRYETIVSARSGIVDYIWELKTRKIILYPFSSRLDWGCGRAIHAWTTKGFDQSDCLVEFEWSQDELEQLADKIVDMCKAA